MAVIESTYCKAPFPLINGHLQTLLPSLFRKGFSLPYVRERLELADGDFLDIDWLTREENDLLVVLTHGLEGSSRKHYITGIASLLFPNGWDVLAWNCRSCSGEMNRTFRLYDHGAIGDIGLVIEHALSQKTYRKILLVGISMGGNISLKYLGVNGKDVPGPVVKAIALSTPVDLRSAIVEVEKPGNFIYHRRFLGKLKEKIRAKNAQFPGRLDVSRLDQIRVWREFDELYSAPINGYRDAEDFYDQASAVRFVGGLDRPVLLINAWNDPLLGETCFPQDLARKHPLFDLEAPRQGGHVGFSQRGDRHTWAERRVLEVARALM